MNISLKPYSKLVKNHPFRVNPRVKENDEKEINCMFLVGMVFYVDEYELTSPIGIQRKSENQ